MTDPTPILSPKGRNRRAAILSESLRAVDARRRRRIAIRTSSLFIALTVVGLAAQLINRSHNASSSDQIANTPTAPAQLFTANSTPTPNPAHVESISDDELLALLSQTGNSYGLVSIGPRTELVRNDLTR